MTVRSIRKISGPLFQVKKHFFVIRLAKNATVESFIRNKEISADFGYKTLKFAN